MVYQLDKSKDVQPFASNVKKASLPLDGLCCTNGVKCVLPLSPDGHILRILWQRCQELCNVLARRCGFGSPRPAGRSPALWGSDLVVSHNASWFWRGFALCLDPRAVNQKVQRASPTTILQVYVQRLLTAAKGVEIRHLPAQPHQFQQILNKACRLPKRHPEQHLQCQPGLDRGVTELLPPTAFTRYGRYPDRLGIKSDW